MIYEYSLLRKRKDFGFRACCLSMLDFVCISLLFSLIDRVKTCESYDRRLFNVKMYFDISFDDF